MSKIWIPMCFLLTVYAEAVIVTRQKREANEMDSIDNFEPRAKYLQQWSQKFTELNEIPQCKNVPDFTAEEASLAETCPRMNKNILCSNIFLFSAIREMCAPIFNNKEQLKQSMREIMAEKGLGTFSSTPVKEISDEVAIKTGLKITNFLSRDMSDLIMEVTHEATAAKNN